MEWMMVGIGNELVSVVADMDDTAGAGGITPAAMHDRNPRPNVRV
jgi:hypothetical protein